MLWSKLFMNVFDIIIDDVLTNNVIDKPKPKANQIKLNYDINKESQILNSLLSLENHWINNDLIVESWSKFKSESIFKKPSIAYNNFINNIISKAKKLDEESLHTYKILKESNNTEDMMDTKNLSLISLVENRNTLIENTKKSIVDMKPLIINFWGSNLVKEDSNNSSIDEKLFEEQLNTINKYDKKLAKMYELANVDFPINETNISINIIKDIEFIRLLMLDTKSGKVESKLDKIVAGKLDEKEAYRFFNHFEIINKEIQEILDKHLDKITEKTNYNFNKESLHNALKYSKSELKYELEKQITEILSSQLGYSEQTKGRVSSKVIASKLINGKPDLKAILSLGQKTSPEAKNKKRKVFDLIITMSKAIDEAFRTRYGFVDRMISKLNLNLGSKYENNDLQKSIVDHGQAFLNEVIFKAKSIYQKIKKEIELELSDKKFDPYIIESLSPAFLPTSYARLNKKSEFPLAYQFKIIQNNPKENESESFEPEENRPESFELKEDRSILYINKYIDIALHSTKLTDNLFDKISEYLIKDISNRNVLISEIMREIGLKITNNKSIKPKDKINIFKLIMNNLINIIIDLNPDITDHSSFYKLIKSIIAEKFYQSLDILTGSIKNPNENNVGNILIAAIKTNKTKCVDVAFDLIKNIPNVPSIPLKEQYIDDKNENESEIEFNYYIASGINPNSALIKHYLKIKDETKASIKKIAIDYIDFAINTYGKYIYGLKTKNNMQITKLIKRRKDIELLIKDNEASKIKKFDDYSVGKMERDIKDIDNEVLSIKKEIASNIINNSYPLNPQDPQNPVRVLNPRNYDNDSKQYNDIVMKIISNNQKSYSIYQAINDKFPDAIIEMDIHNGIWSPTNEKFDIDNAKTPDIMRKLKRYDETMASLKNELLYNLGKVKSSNTKELENKISSRINGIQKYINFNTVPKNREVSGANEDKLIDRISTIFEQYKTVLNRHSELMRRVEKLEKDPEYFSEKMSQYETNADKNEELFPYKMAITDKTSENYIEIESKNNKFKPIIIKTGDLQFDMINRSLEDNIDLKHKKQFNENGFVSYYFNTSQILEILNKLLPNMAANPKIRFTGSIIGDALKGVDGRREYTKKINIPAKQIKNAIEKIEAKTKNWEKRNFSAIKSKKEKESEQDLKDKGLSPEQIENYMSLKNAFPELDK